jgi:hypothetical protein
MLLIIGHPSIGSALETLLRIENRYDTKRLQSLDQIAPALEGWDAGLALVDGVLLESGRTEGLAMPTIVLSGNPADGKRLATRLPHPAGWLRKDATAEELRFAIERTLRRSAARRPSRLAVAFAAVAAVAAAAYAMVAFGPGG